MAIGASAAGARTYTATSSQGLLFMAEAVYNAAGLGLPIVMTIGNRAIGAPINIWNDHSDSMSMRDAGWIQLFAETNQEALDLHIQAFRLAEELSCPVMVCMDGFILTHAYERVDMPTQAQVDAFLPPFEPRQVLDPAEPVTIGAMVGPEAFTEVRYLAHHKQLRALTLIPQLVGAVRERSSAATRAASSAPTAPRTPRRSSSRSARSTAPCRKSSTRCAPTASPIGSVSICSFRPFPLAALRDALQHAKRVVVLEKCLAVGLGGIVSDGVRKALSGIQLKGYTVIAASAAARSRARRCTQLFEDAGRRRARAGDLPRPQRRRRRARARARERARAAPARPPRRSCGASAPSARGSAEPRTKRQWTDCRPSSSTRPARSPSATGCSPRTSARCRPTCERTNSLNSGHRACQGCGEALGARYAIDAAMRATNNQLIAVNATGCLEVFSTPYPGDVVADPVDPLAVRQRRGGRLGRRRGDARARAATTSA